MDVSHSSKDRQNRKLNEVNVEVQAEGVCRRITRHLAPPSIFHAGMKIRQDNTEQRESRSEEKERQTHHHNLLKRCRRAMSDYHASLTSLVRRSSTSVTVPGWAAGVGRLSSLPYIRDQLRTAMRGSVSVLELQLELGARWNLKGCELQVLGWERLGLPDALTWAWTALIRKVLRYLECARNWKQKRGTRIAESVGPSLRAMRLKDLRSHSHFLRLRG